MNARFNVINKKGLTLCFVIMVINGVISAVSLAQLLSGGAKLWLLPIIVFVTFFLIAALVMTQIVSAGIDVKRGTVIMTEYNSNKGKKPIFNVKDLKSLSLQNQDGKILNVDTDSLIGARIVFTLKNDETHVYYPVSITKKQYKSIESGFNSFIDRLNNDDLFDDDF